MTRPALVLVVLAVGLATACGEEPQDMMAAEAVRAGDTVPAMSPQPGSSTPEPAAPAPSQTAPAPSQPAGPADEPNGSAAAGAEPPQGMEPMPGSFGSGRYPDACTERRVSWLEPCHDNPDPCDLNSGWSGDEYCLLPPPDGEGVQIHFGPKSYDDDDEVAGYVLQPGQEFNSYAIVNIPTTEDRWYSYMKLSMRPGSHHLINSVIAGHPEEGFLRQGASCEADRVGGFPGTQNLIMESPPQGVPAPENEGLGRMLPGNASICQNYHRYNYTDEPVLNEIWYNVWFADESEITQRAGGIFVIAGPYAGIPPGTQQVIEGNATVNGDGRILSLFGHRHAATERFAVWLEDELIYDSWDWVESRVFNYDSITDNPAPDPSSAIDGAVSGIVEVHDGENVRFECHVNNQTDGTLRFSNELLTGEMCILFGSTIGASITGGR